MLCYYSVVVVRVRDMELSDYSYKVSCRTVAFNMAMITIHDPCMSVHNTKSFSCLLQK